jgi:type IV pilus assembly protein PilM
MPGRAIDPYRSWLSVRSARRPLTAYELLCLDPSEATPERIAAAASRQRAALMSQKATAPPDLWLRVHREVEEAIHVLQDDHRRAAYEARLAAASGKTGGSAAGSAPNGHGAKAAAAATSAAAVMAVACSCGRNNLPDRKFCAGCGRPLREPCPRCGDPTLASEVYCGSCGVHLPLAIKEAAERREADIARAKELLSRHAFDAAEELLKVVTQPSHRALEPIAQSARDLLEEIDGQRKRYAALIPRVGSQAAERRAAHDFAAAVALLESIPETLRSPEFARLLEECKAKVAEVSGLAREIRAAVEAGPTVDSLPIVERFLELQPDHTQARRLAEKLRAGKVEHARQERRRLVEAARRILSSGDYDQAARLLRRVPETVIDDEVKRLTDVADELGGMLRALRLAPVIDNDVLGIADRLCKLAPNDARVASVARQTREAFASGPKDPLTQLPAGAPGPKPAHAGLDVDWFIRLSRIETGKVAGTSWSEHPGRFAVALGLALQGLGRAEFTANLAPAPTTNVLSRIGAMFRKPSAVRSAWGVDLGSSSLKAVRLAWNDGSQRPEVEAWDFVEHAKPPTQTNDYNERRDIYVDTLRRFRNRNSDAETVCLNVPGPQVLGRWLILPPIPDEKIADLARYEIRQQVPYPPDDMYWDYELLSDDDPDVALLEEDERPRRLLLLATKSFVVDQRMELLREAGMAASLVQCDNLALHNFVAFEHFPKPPDEETARSPTGPCVAILDVGGSASNLVISSPGWLWFRSLPRGGDDFTKAITRQFNVTRAKADHVKCNVLATRRLSRFDAAVLPVCEELAKELHRSMASYASLNRRSPIERMLCLGGGFRLFGLWRYLRHGQ